LFGKYNIFVDEIIQILLSGLVSSIGLFFGMSWKLVVICFLLGVFVDIDHLFNGIIAKLFRIKDYEFDLHFWSKGHTIKIFHGFDMSLLFAFISYMITSNIIFSVLVFVNLGIHELWDFLVYPHSWKELFLFARIKNKFTPGTRKWGVGLIFKKKGLKY